MSEPIVINVTGDVVVNTASKAATGRCKTCAHWHDGLVPHWGVCHALVFDGTPQCLTPVRVTEGVPPPPTPRPTVYFTRHDFGCVLWEAKP